MGEVLNEEEADFVEHFEDATLPSEYMGTKRTGPSLIAERVESVEEADTMTAEWVEHLNIVWCSKFDSALPRLRTTGMPTLNEASHCVPPDSQMLPIVAGRWSGPRPQQRVDGSVASSSWWTTSSTSSSSTRSLVGTCTLCKSQSNPMLRSLRHATKKAHGEESA